MYMSEDEAKYLGLQLMEVAEAAYLTTIDANGYPQTRAMFNLRNRDQFSYLWKLFHAHGEEFLVLFIANTSSAKIGQIRNNPAVSVYYCKPNEWRGLMLGGLIEVVTDPKLKETLWQDRWKLYYPKGVNDPDYTVLSLHPQKARYYHRLRKCDIIIKERK
jgi:general stress protein 26